MRKTGTILVLFAFAGAAWAQTTVQSTTTYGGNLGVRSGMPSDMSSKNQGTTSVRDGQGMVTSDGGIALQSDATQMSGSVPAVSGGVSLNARDNLRSQVPPHNVKMVFALNTGNYVSDVGVQVKNSAGKMVLDDVSNGPWLYAQLPPGSYTATATYNGKAVTHRFSVGSRGVKTAQFRWPASVEGAVAPQGATVESGAEGQILGTGPQEPQEQR
jgi:hypothetical protein